jgi:serine protease Do
MKMKKSVWITVAGIATLAPVLMALPGRSSIGQEQDQVQEDRAVQGPRTTIHRVQGAGTQGPDSVEVLVNEGPSWLGVEAREVTAENVKEFKLTAERGVVVGHVSPESPASKAGLKDTDVITEVDGQRVEGSAQFRRMIREIPAGRNVQLTIWRDGRSQTVSATLAQAEENHRAMLNAAPGSFAFRMPEIPEMPDVEVQRMPGIPSMDFDNGMMVLPFNRPRLGIDAEDISGQLGSYFGAPDGEGVLVRNVNAGSVAEKAGVKAGDVITKFNGDRIRSLGDLHEKLAAKTDDKPAQLSVLRNKSEVTLTVDVPATKPARRRTTRSSTNI